MLRLLFFFGLLTHIKLWGKSLFIYFLLTKSRFLFCFAPYLHERKREISIYGLLCFTFCDSPIKTKVITDLAVFMFKVIWSTAELNSLTACSWQQTHREMKRCIFWIMFLQEASRGGGNKTVYSTYSELNKPRTQGASLLGSANTLTSGIPAGTGQHPDPFTDTCTHASCLLTQRLVMIIASPEGARGY